MFANLHPVEEIFGSEPYATVGVEPFVDSDERHSLSLLRRGREERSSRFAVHEEVEVFTFEGSLLSGDTVDQLGLNNCIRNRISTPE
ncbi:Predicted ATP-dependent endonuclease of the OLD family [Pseudomonas syringae pv. actinidiae]|uniref:Predicted ATP-dependent endonuclease of the OLD family n=1 Tax=Pseudomonas syringae pv. actinidiae TaxID=103796 RepID=A0AAN4Q4Y6_PSESF|nr:Predicted ATP-dependent endonuclease of the OLD family [Pseudomonas syringae pv. actinidiae]